MEKKTVKVLQTHIEISPYEIGEQPSLELDNCIKEKLTIGGNYITKPHPIFVYKQSSKTLLIPRGLTSVSSLEELFDVQSFSSNKCDPFDRATIQLLNKPRDKTQDKAIRFLTNDKGFEANSRYGRKLLEFDTGIGKTFCAITSICKIGAKAAIIVDKEGLMNQWVSAISEFTNMMEEEVYKIRGAKSVDKLLAGKCKGYKLFLVSHQTITSYAQSHGLNSITEIFRAMNVGIKVFDEAHKMMKGTILIDLLTNTCETWYLTATALRSNKDENKVYKKIYGPIPTLVYKRKKEDAYIKSTILEMNSNATQMDQSVMKTFKGMSNAKYMEYIAFDRKSRELFLRALHLVIEACNDTPETGKIAILVGKRNVAKYVYEIIPKLFPKYENKVGLYTSDVKGATKEAQKDKDIIVTTYKSFGEAMDVKDLRYVYMTESFSSEVIIKQTMGRLREIGGTSYFIMLIDTSIKSRVKQYKDVKDFILMRSVSCKSNKIN